MPTTPRVTPADNRIFNFSAGPAVLPVPVLEQMQRELVALPGVGMSVLEISHRSDAFESILVETESCLRALAKVPSSHHIVFLQGGASTQFSMVPMNLLDPGTVADYVDTGSWSEKAVKEAKKIGSVNIAASTREAGAGGYVRVPSSSELSLASGAAYVHVTSNNTIEGTQFESIPDVGAAPLVSDMSSDIFSRPIDISRFALIYAGAQKNLGPAGVTLVIVREDMLERSRAKKSSLPSMLNYAIHADNRSLYNTPPVFAVYCVGLVAKWLKAQGGLATVGQANEQKATRLYAEIDRTEFYRGTAEKSSRSLMNVTFRLPTAELEQLFVKESTAAGLDGLKGHRSVGGMRASLYNACPPEAVEALVTFMQDFERRRG